MEEKEVFSSVEENLILQVCGILEENGINFIRKDDGVGEYLNVTLGNYATSMESRIFVKVDDYDKAKSIIDEFLGEMKDVEEDLDEEFVKDAKKYRKMKRIIALIPFVMSAVALILVIIAVIRDNIN